MKSGTPPLSPNAHLRMDQVLEVLRDHSPRSLVEVGLGRGTASWFLAKDYEYTGYEPDRDSYEAARVNLSGLSHAEIVNGPLPETPTREFDALVAFEVLEHVENDRDALAHWASWVRPGGLVVISTPAHQSRYGPWDEVVGHFRRYDRGQLASVMSGAGLVEVSIAAYGMPLGYLLEWVRDRLLSRRLEKGTLEEGTARSGRSFQPSRAAGLIRAALLPFCLMQRPFRSTDLGTGWIAWGHRTS